MGHLGLALRHCGVADPGMGGATHSGSGLTPNVGDEERCLMKALPNSIRWRKKPNSFVVVLVLVNLAVLIFPASLADEQKKAGAVVPLDLSGFYQQIWSDLDPEKSCAAIPRGLLILRVVPFQLCCRVVHNRKQYA